MKIAILSLVPGHNYGGIMQSYALKTVLERMGYEVHVVSRERKIPPLISFRQIPCYVKRIFHKFFHIADLPVLAEYSFEKNRRFQLQYMLTFCNRYLNLRQIREFTEIEPGDFDTFVVGSDQVWRPKYFEEQYCADIDNAYLSFAAQWDVKRIAYGPSFGVDEWEYTEEQTKRCAELLSRFDALSVREESGVSLCREYFGCEDVIQVCDPTMLLSKEDYESLISPDTPHFEGNMLVYCLDEGEELERLVSRITEEKLLKPFRFNSVSGVRPSVESWLRGFQNADFIITDSFHACVFSLLFHKPFVVFGNVMRGVSRIESLLKTFNQEDRLLYDASGFHDDLLTVSFDTVEDTFKSLREKSLNYLQQSLEMNL